MQKSFVYMPDIFCETAHQKHVFCKLRLAFKQTFWNWLQAEYWIPRTDFIAANVNIRVFAEPDVVLSKLWQSPRQSQCLSKICTRVFHETKILSLNKLNLYGFWAKQFPEKNVFAWIPNFWLCFTVTKMSLGQSVKAGRPGFTSSS